MYEFDNNIPIYKQLIDIFITKIINGEWNRGEKIYSVRELAQEYKVNANTVQKTLSEIETMGLLYTERTAGRFVTEDTSLINEVKERYIKDIVTSSILDLKKVNLKKEEVIELISSLWEE